MVTIGSCIVIFLISVALVAFIAHKLRQMKLLFNRCFYVIKQCCIFFRNAPGSCPAASLNGRTGFGSYPKAPPMVWAGFGSYPIPPLFVWRRFGSCPKAPPIVWASFGSYPRASLFVWRTKSVLTRPRGNQPAGLQSTL